MTSRIKAPIEKPATHTLSTDDRERGPSIFSGQKRLFQAVLNQIQKADKALSQHEINSANQEIKSLQMAVPIHKTDGKTRYVLKPAKTTPEEGLNAMTTATMLRLNSIAPRYGALAMNLMNPPHVHSGSSEGQGVQDAAGTAPRGRGLPAVQGLGDLSAHFESGGEGGVDAIGYDDQGGTSYGLYQISSRAGTMRQFIGYLKDLAPDWAKRLSSAGPLNTGGRGGSVPREWNRIAGEDPQRFSELQRSFIEETLYLPAVQEIQESTGVDVQQQSKALQEVLWSTAVQHGPGGASRIFSRAIGKPDPAQTASRQFEHELIDKVYSARGRQFGSSTAHVRAAVRRRFAEEKEMALAMLSGSEQSQSFRA